MFEDEDYGYETDYDSDRNDQDGRLDSDAYCDEVERKAEGDERD